MDKRIGGVVIALAVIVVGLVFWFQFRESDSHMLPPNSQKQIMDQQIQDIQNSTSMPPQQKEAAIARIRANADRNVKTK